MNECKYTNIVFAGGGSKGMSYIGAIKALNDTGAIKNVKKIIGTSVGSIFTVIAGCKCTNYELDQYANKFLHDLTTNSASKGLFDGGIKSILKKGVNMYLGLGVHSNEFIYNSINSFLLEKYGIKNMTFEQYFDATNIDITIVGTCMTTRTIEYFNTLTHSKMEIAKAVQISTAIPIYFSMVEWNGMMWIDGGVGENFALDYFDSNYESYDPNTLGFFLKSAVNVGQQYIIKTPVDLIEGVESIAYESSIRKSIKDASRRNIVYIDTGLISGINFMLSEDDKTFLIMSGYYATVDFLTKE
jgi:NTE family protein